MFETFENTIRTELNEFLTTRKMQQAIELSKATGQHFNHNQYPMYFVGKLDAHLILVHLNPYQHNDYSPTYTAPLQWTDFDQYFSYHQHFGKHQFGPTSDRTHRSKFDHKQVRFLKPFGVINFAEGNTQADVFTNLERVIDHKLQLELIPYGSQKFSARGFTTTMLQPHFERILDVIAACPREYVLFCGKVFERFFRTSITRTHVFKLPRSDGNTAQDYARFSNLEFEYKGQVIYAGLAHSFARQGLAITAYGQYCKTLYHAQ